MNQAFSCFPKDHNSHVTVSMLKKCSELCRLLGTCGAWKSDPGGWSGKEQDAQRHSSTTDFFSLPHLPQVTVPGWSEVVFCLPCSLWQGENGREGRKRSQVQWK